MKVIRTGLSRWDSVLSQYEKTRDKVIVIYYRCIKFDSH